MNSIQIIPHKPELAQEFERINKAWISKYFVLEEVDKEVLENPQKNILDSGGAILYAQLDKQIVGAVALKKLKNGDFELTKMGVDENFRGKGIGQKLLSAAIEKAKEMQLKKIVLFSSRSLKPAISLYLKNGFNEVPVEVGKDYSRCDIKMELLF